MQVILERIAAWQAAGLIDPETAIRLRSDEPDRDDAPTADGDSMPEARQGPSTIAQIFGPSVTIGEMFAYLGGAFILGAFDAFMTRLAGFTAEGGVGLAIGYGFAAIVLIAIGRFLAPGDARERRAAGGPLRRRRGPRGGGRLRPDGGVLHGILGRRRAGCRMGGGLRGRPPDLSPALPTQFTLLASLTGLAAALLTLTEHLVVPETVFSDSGVVVSNGGPSPLLILVATALWWLVVGALLGILGLIEARSGDDPATGRRAALTRLWAGITAVAGLASAISQSAYDPETGEWGRVLEPWIGDLALIVLALILVERAFRRGAGAFVYAAALALVIALTGFNFSYLTDSTEVGLLVEGLILLAAGFAVGKLRQRIGGDATPLEAASLPTPA